MPHLAPAAPHNDNGGYAVLKASKKISAADISKAIQFRALDRQFIMWVTCS